ncbi:MAG: hypothetical protein J0H74_14115 [Chitinophagaceae bacterium]|nr:hypothetical protein [Chitinophagaceae bacterium]
MPRHITNTRPIFVFLGVTEPGTDANINLLQERLEKLPAVNNQPIKIEPKGDLLILTLFNPDFCFYVALVKNDNGELPYWTDLARNSELSWDKKPVSATRLKCIYDFLEEEGKSAYNTYHEIGFAILNELEKFTRLKVFTIPSVEKRGLWRKIFNT